MAAMQIDAVPQRVSRSATLEALGSLGFDMRNLRSIEFGANGIWVEAVAVDDRPADAEGTRQSYLDGNQMPNHRVYVRYTEDI